MTSTRLGKVIFIIASIAGCVLLFLVTIPRLGYDSLPYQINNNQWAKEVPHQSVPKHISYNQIPITGEVEANHNQETTTSSSNKKWLDDKPSWMDLKTEEMSAELHPVLA